MQHTLDLDAQGSDLVPINTDPPSDNTHTRTFTINYITSIITTSQTDTNKHMLFRYWNPIDKPPRFQCTLISVQCQHVRSNGDRCRRIQNTGVALCKQHLQFDMCLKIATSTVHNGGLGLFACDNHKDEGDVVFTFSRKRNRGDHITDYTGQVLANAETDHRYGRNNTVPYGVRLNPNSNIDAACIRGAGSYANHQPRSKANARLISDGKRVYIEATKLIRNGDEIFIDYGRDYHIRLNGIAYSHQTRAG